MKQWRCPHCGEERLPLTSQYYCFGTRFNPRRYGKCGCGGTYKVKARRNRWFGPALFVATGALTILCFALAFWAITWEYEERGWCILFLILTFVAPLVYITIGDDWIARVCCIPEPYDEQCKTYIHLESDAEVVLDGSAEKVYDHGTYGVRFDRQTRVVRFHEVFLQGLVPMTFYRCDHTASTRVHILKAEFVPPELLAEGSRFTVVDNGKEIATGMISKIYEKN